MAEIPNTNETWLNRIITLINKSPLIAIIFYLVYTVYGMQKSFDAKEERREQREIEREKENKQVWMAYREDKLREMNIKEAELKIKYEKDSAQNKN